MNTTARYKEIILQRLQFHACSAISGAVLRNARADVVMAHNADAMIANISAFIAGDTVTEVDKTFPATWLDAVKDRWVPNWARRWVSIQYRQIKVDKHTLFPSIEIPNHTAHIALAVTDRTWSSLLNDEDDT